MYLESLASSVPEHSFTQTQCLEIIESTDAYHGLGLRQRTIIKNILAGDSGISKRHFAFEDPSVLFDMDATSLIRSFEKEAPELSVTALDHALEKASILATDLDALFICTCTGYLCPGLTSHVSEKLGMRSDVYLSDVVGLGCGAAIPTIRAAHGFLAAHPGAKVATIAVEICSAAFYIDQDIGVLISLSLFGDAAVAAIWSNQDSDSKFKADHFQTLHWPEEREKIRFINQDGKLKNQLHRSVPKVAAKAVKELFDQRSCEPDQVISHAGGRDVIDQISSVLPDFQLNESRSVLKEFGNCSSPSVLLALENRLNGPHSDKNLWLTSFGAGFSAHSMELNRI